MVTLREHSFIEELKMTFTLLNAYKSAAHSNVIAYENSKDIEITLKELTKLAEKKKWNEKFYKSYKGGKAKFSIEQISFEAMFLVANLADKEVGYVRLTQCCEYAEYGAPCVWCISEAYVKPGYRNNGVLREMLKILVTNYNVKLIHIETQRAVTHENYYRSLGFTNVARTEFTDLIYLIQADFAPILDKHAQANDEHYNLAA